jgi:hypothetical protein
MGPPPPACSHPPHRSSRRPRSSSVLAKPAPGGEVDFGAPAPCPLPRPQPAPSAGPRPCPRPCPRRLLDTAGKELSHHRSSSAPVSLASSNLYSWHRTGAAVLVGRSSQIPMMRFAAEALPRAVANCCPGPLTPHPTAVTPRRVPPPSVRTLRHRPLWM